MLFKGVKMNFGEYLTTHPNISQSVLRDIKWFGCELLNCSLFNLNNQQLSAMQIKKLNSTIKKLNKDVPLAYITKSAYFYNQKFFVNKNVLIPRMETEQLLELIINENKDKKDLKILDMCTGSGCIAITLKNNLNCVVTAVDYSTSALKVAKKNAKLLNAQINFVHSNMFDKLNTKYDIIVSNPPYIKTDIIKTLDNNVKDYEPKQALDGGQDGLDFYKIIATTASQYLKENGVLYLEIGHDQGTTVPKLLTTNFKDIIVKKDYDDQSRIVKCIRR